MKIERLEDRIALTSHPAIALQMERVGEEAIFTIVSTGEGFIDMEEAETDDVLARATVPIRRSEENAWLPPRADP